MPVITPPSSGSSVTARATSFLFGPGVPFGGNTAATTTAATLNDGDNAVAGVFLPSKVGTIDRIGLYSANTGTPPQYKLAIVTVDASGNPTTTPYGGSAEQSFTMTAGWAWYTLSTPAVVALDGGGSLPIIAAQIRPGTSAPDGSNFVAINQHNSIIAGAGLPYSAAFTTAWAKSVNQPLICARYTDGTVVGGMPLNLASGSVVLNDTSFNSGTTPDEIGCLFSLPFACKCAGAVILQDPGSTSNTWSVKLYDTDGATVLASWVDGDAAKRSGVSLGTDGARWAEVDLLAATSYRLTCLPLESSNRAIVQATVDSDDSRAWYPEGLRWQRTHRTDAGAWTETATKLPLFALRVSEVSA